MDLQTLLLPCLIGVAVVAAAIALFPSMFGDSVAKRRQESIQNAGAKRVVNERVIDQATRRKQVADSLKEIEQKGTTKKQTIQAKIHQAGFDWTRNQFLLASLGLGLVLGGLTFALNGSLLAAGPVFVVGSLGFPRWTLSYLRNRRLKRFRQVFPDALDVIIRGVKSGLPLGDCLRIVGTDGSEPVRSEFKQIIQAQAIGLPVSEAVDRMAERVPIPEAGFFSIVIAIQQKAGGNLSEALANLSRVLRDRKKMEGKIKAMSSEAKASAMIIGALPFAVGFLVWLTSPHYIELLWLTSTGHMVIVGCLIWMGIGVGVIKKMISFDF
jgi:tight adherence protein B